MAPVLNEPLGSCAVCALMGSLFHPWAPLAKGPVPETLILSNLGSPWIS